MLKSRVDQSFITLLGFDVDSFFYIVKKIAPLFDNNSPFLDDYIRTNRGRKRLIRVEDCVALFLAWTRTRGSMFVLQMIFGMTQSNLSFYLWFGRRLFVHSFSDDNFAKIAFPNEVQIMEYVKAIESKHPALKDKKVWCSMDGLKLYIERPPDETTQSRYYNGWTHDHYVTNVFVFTPDGTIPMAYFNIPGCIHGSQVAEWGNIYTKFENMFDRYGVQCAVDSGFGKIDNDFMVKSTQDDLTSNKTTQQEAKLDVRMKRAATSMWQSAEWGMRGFQASFPRMKD